ncbi:MAG: YdeI/OmpD-associated family protein [Actinomycetota bacterium]|nr:YdeI/OmpD-associated family protein [Actinomycetota bacterium]
MSEPGRDPRLLDVPSELREALAADPGAHAAFETLAPSHRSEYARWVDEAKRPETRRRRAERTLAALRERGEQPQAG